MRGVGVVSISLSVWLCSGAGTFSSPYGAGKAKGRASGAFPSPSPSDSPSPPPNVLVMFPSRMTACGVIGSEFTTLKSLSLMFSPSSLTNSGVRGDLLKAKSNWLGVNSFVSGDSTRPYPSIDSCPSMSRMLDSVTSLVSAGIAGDMTRKTVGSRIGAVMMEHLVILDGDRMEVTWDDLKDTYYTRSLTSPTAVLIPGCLSLPWDEDMETHTYNPREQEYNFVEDIKNRQTQCNGCMEQFINSVVGMGEANPLAISILTLLGQALQDTDTDSLPHAVTTHINRTMANVTGNLLIGAAQAMTILEELKNEISIGLKDGRVTQSINKYYKAMGCK